MARRAVLTVALACVLAVVVAAFGCRSVVTPPQQVQESAVVFVADYGRHSSLLLPREYSPERAGTEAAYVEYAYGQWDWYALAKTEWYRGVAILAFPSQGTLGRSEWVFQNVSVEGVKRAMRLEHAHEVVVERERVDALRTALGQRFEANAGTRIHNALYGLDFVHDDEKYWLLNHCNTAVAGWLRQLGCEVHGSPLDAAYRVEKAGG